MAVLAVLAALGAACAFGVAAVLQALGTSRTHDVGGLDPHLLVRLARQPVFLAALGLNGVGFLLHLSALQALPLFLVQAIIAGSVAVTAVLSVRVFEVALAPGQCAAVATVVVGLALVAPSAAVGEPVRTGDQDWLVLSAAVVALGLAAVGVGRVQGAAGAVLLGLLAGGGFGIVAVCARLLPDLSLLTLLRTPVAYVLVLSGALAFLLYSTAMQRGSVTTTTAAMVVTQTAVPALVGALLLGDRVRAGFLPFAVAGFTLAVAGAVGLARFEHVETLQR